ncbi:ADP-ribosylglycohydrolase family protein [Jonesia quinghaiensis]|uniref:ADP-ribosylglycohydrolase family protein n=1 Tax=Jonesia quinghaiensis TaxID=262806 RepID=UPI0003FEBE8A|nr:ADP-ribosylglycohydrolase family protein [Jonesia quinghaiensis]
MERAISLVISSAVGDALGAPYEFLPPLPHATPITVQATHLWERGEWTDDTSMAIPILEQLAAGASLHPTNAATQDTLGRIVSQWLEWAQNAKDIGTQTRAVFAHIPESAVTAQAARDAARMVHEQTGRSAGNGSLMRTGPVVLAALTPEFLTHYPNISQHRRFEDFPSEYLTTVSGAVRSVSELTHYEHDASDACVMWVLTALHSLLTGELDIRSAVDALPSERATRWHGFLDEAQTHKPWEISNSNYWVVGALQCAWSAMWHGHDLTSTLELAVRCGEDTDTVAAITGTLAGALYGHQALPGEWHEHLHGWPSYTADDLTNLVMRAINR